MFNTGTHPDLPKPISPGTSARAFSGRRLALSTQNDLLGQGGTQVSPPRTRRGTHLHALNSAFALLELLLTSAPPTPLLALPVQILLMSAYLGVAYVTKASQGVLPSVPLSEFLLPSLFVFVGRRPHVLRPAILTLGQFDAPCAARYLRPSSFAPLLLSSLPPFSLLSTSLPPLPVSFSTCTCTSLFRVFFFQRVPWPALGGRPSFLPLSFVPPQFRAGWKLGVSPAFLDSRARPPARAAAAVVRTISCGHPSRVRYVRAAEAGGLEEVERPGNGVARKENTGAVAAAP
ncbi:hypothetical protein FB451DRAFT_1392701 [Mycena latifolia]|nr:hypothetical protein FB451DRAFT_1392701 [Mycena latifolia]